MAQREDINQVQVMLDLETWGSHPGAIIVSIGAVKFTVADGILGEFYSRVDAHSCYELGLRPDVPTISWWMQQSDQARSEALGDGDHVHLVLAKLVPWLQDAETIWGCGGDFDPPILEEAFRRARIPSPWDFRAVRCYRTLKCLRPDITIERQGVSHHALDDAIYQTRRLLKILRTLEAERELAAAATEAEDDAQKGVEHQGE